jgi:LPS O-antigen subunit length determinant protein (WzzB/FepE family)
MFWIIAPIALIGAAVAAIASSVSDEEKTARQSWHTKRAEVVKSLEEHRRIIELHISQAQESYDFSFLCDLHFSSHKVADSAYSLLVDARTSLGSISSILDMASVKKNEIKDQLNNARGDQRKELLSEIRSLNEFKTKVIEDHKTIKAQKDALYNEVVRLNNQTRNLKEAIRDRCGEKGRDWYTRLEQRKTERRR